MSVIIAKALISSRLVVKWKISIDRHWDLLPHPPAKNAMEPFRFSSFDGLNQNNGLTEQQVCGPLWIGPIHDHTFTKRMIDHVESSDAKYGTLARMKGMLTVAHNVRDLSRRIFDDIDDGRTGA